MSLSDLFRKKKVGPLGQAVAILNRVVRHTIKDESYGSSQIYKSVHILLDSLKKHRLALDAALKLVIVWKSNKVDIEVLSHAIRQFEACAQQARVDEYLPFDDTPAIEIAGDQIKTAPLQ